LPILSNIHLSNPTFTSPTTFDRHRAILLSSDARAKHVEVEHLGPCLLPLCQPSQ
jgi:hypothetical protein